MAIAVFEVSGENLQEICTHIYSSQSYMTQNSNIPNVISSLSESVVHNFINEKLIP